jgi:hypothetical protein
MVDRVPRSKFLEPLRSRSQLIGLVMAGLATIAVLVAIFTDVLPFVAVVIVGFLGGALLIYRDLQDGNHARQRGHSTQPKIAHVKRHGKRPAPRH